MSSVIMRRPEIAKSDSHSEQRGSTATNETMSFSTSRQSSGPRAGTNASTFDLPRMRTSFEHVLDKIASFAMVAGVFVVPLATLIAMACAWLPEGNPLHRAAPTFFAVASLWFITALLLSHFQPRDGDAMARETA